VSGTRPRLWLGVLVMIGLCACSGARPDRLGGTVGGGSPTSSRPNATWVRDVIATCARGDALLAPIVADQPKSWKELATFFRRVARVQLRVDPQLLGHEPPDANAEAFRNMILGWDRSARLMLVAAREIDAGKIAAAKHDVRLLGQANDEANSIAIGLGLNVCAEMGSGATLAQY
jgi:hypothetical protein